ncbi:hypothetical protein [Burkholderia ubonensis]|uniref:hypothetical protein n=1 Tax=Burkholderia ubonensis TaxID=101571 RepID=UPI0007525D40|nr:hypothetical protein [Burkholderia ubonensis]KVD71678.1 hypothetical protein WI88_29025 [Burkholderia ubonensis]KVP02066.1 hypothetical protein WJ83_12220 [Burkholderia ubonensis]KVP54020.1 hypothetical protein WJ91_22965 [Burkholderia ubonensis]KVW66426.1 hypothetical protein WK99_11070 [Burkholderia ubonensis]OJA59016.1 hypothetical protein BGV69_10130 [Burkholderia ubonensis]
MTIIAPPDVRSTGIRRFRRARRTRSLACAGLFAALAGCAAQPATERQIGSGGSLVRYSSSQTEVDLTDAEQQALRMLSDRSYAGATQAHVLDAVAGVLRAQGYAPVTVERDTGLVEAGRSDTLLPKWRQLLRGAVKARIGFLPAKPDHERVAAIVTVRVTSTRDTVVRARFNRTVWDSNGDSRTKTVVEPDFYQTFFAEVDKAMCATPCGGR